MKQEHGADCITIQSGGMLNAVLVRNGLIDHLLIVIAPLLIDGKATPTLIDGNSFQCEDLEDSYIRLKYNIIQNTFIGSR